MNLVRYRGEGGRDRGLGFLVARGHGLDAADPVHGQEVESNHAAAAVELGVGTTVAAVMATIFFCFAARGRTDD